MTEETALDAALEVCEFCGKAEETIPCIVCGRLIQHSKRGFSIGHTCFDCNIELGKGE